MLPTWAVTMNDMSAADKRALRERYLQKRKDGMSISEMKAELKDRFDNPMDLRHFVSDVDDLYIATLLPASSGIIPGGQFKVWGGLMLFVLGLGLTAYSMFSDDGVHGYVIVWHGAILAGLALYYRGRSEMRRTDQNGRVRENIFDRHRKHRMD